LLSVFVTYHSFSFFEGFQPHLIVNSYNFSAYTASGSGLTRIVAGQYLIQINMNENMQTSDQIVNLGLTLSQMMQLFPEMGDVVDDEKC